MSQNTLNPDDGRYNILIEGAAHDVVLGNYGSDFNAMPQATFDKVVQASPNVSVSYFDQSLQLVGAFKTDNLYSLLPSQIRSMLHSFCRDQMFEFEFVV